MGREDRVEARITVEGAGAAFESLREWLQHEPGLRGRVRTVSAPPPEGALGASTELLVALATSGGGAVAVLARSVSNWLIERERQRRADVTVTVTRPGGGKVSVSVRRAAEAEQALRTALQAATEPSKPGQDR